MSNVPIFCIRAAGSWSVDGGGGIQSWASKALNVSIFYIRAFYGPAWDLIGLPAVKV